MATGRIYNEIFLEHGETWHVENRARLEAILARLQGNGLWDELEELDTYPAEQDQLLWLHDDDYLEELQAISNSGGAALDMDTVANWATWGAATVAAGSCMSAVEDMIEGGVDNALCLVRPPGHHALPSRAMGFCFLNNAALAAEFAVHHDLTRVAIVDWDVHHGNGTQDIFYHRGDVFYTSIHELELFPATGTVDEVGVDAGAGRNVNIPLPRGAQGRHYLRALDEVIIPALRQYKPELLVVSAGYDGHHTDPVAHHELTTDAYHEITARMVTLAQELCEGRLCIILEGGYAAKALAHGVENTALALLGRPLLEPEAGEVQVHPEATRRVDEQLEATIEVHRTRLGL
ncbi:MAG: histone deacetylase [Armatimonadia bacterium]